MKKFYLPIALLSTLPVSAQLTLPVTFIVDMSQETVSANGVHLYGSVQGYNPASTPMADQGGDIYQVTLSLDPATTYTYAFVNGNSLGDIETVPPPCDTGIGSLREFVTPASGPTTLGPFCYAECGPCPTTNYNITFQVDMSQETVSPNGVHIAADWNAFSPSATSMTHQGNGVYTHTESLAGGTPVEFVYVNGNTSGDLETVPGACNTNNHRSLTVPNSNTTLDEVCYGSCTDCFTGIGQPNVQGLEILPTVTRDIVQVTCAAGTATLSVYDMMGRLVSVTAVRGQTQVTVDLEALRTGFYTITAQGQAGIQSGRVLRAQ
jgi:hypothetical protein